MGRGGWLDVFSVCEDVEDHTIHSVDVDLDYDRFASHIRIH